MILVIGNYPAEHRESMQYAIGRAETAQSDKAIRFVPDIVSVKRLLDSSQILQPRCVFIDSDARGMTDFVSWVRGMPHLFTLPVVVLARRVCEPVFAEAHACGVDDVLGDRDLGGLTRRVAIIYAHDADARPPILQGIVVIAHPDEQRRMLLGRVLRQAGFDPVFAGNGDELLALVSKGDKTRLVVISARLLSDRNLSFISRVRSLAKRETLPHIIVGDVDQYHDVASEARRTRGVVFLSELAPLDSLLFVTNELMRRQALGAGADEQRASARLLYGSLSAFRSPGELSAVAGYSYNISREGIYIKTLDPPIKNRELWVELKPPGELAAVHLRGETVWVRGPDLSQAMTSPVGFGMRIFADECPPGDLAVYETAYERYLMQSLPGSVRVRP